jgi:hypothetical protein
VRKARITTVLLVAVLVITNAWWAYRILDAGVSQTYLRASQDSTAELLSQSLAVLQVVAKPQPSRSEIVKAAAVPGDTVGPFEKDGYVWVGQLGLQFNEQGRLVKAVAGTGASER